MSQSHEAPDRQSATGTPRWLKVSVVIVIVFVLLFGIMHLTSGSRMGPGMHMPPTEQGTQQP